MSIENLKKRYFRKVIAYPEGIITHDGDCWIYSFLGVCNCGLIHDLLPLEYTKIKELAPGIIDQIAEQEEIFMEHTIRHHEGKENVSTEEPVLPILDFLVACEHKNEKDGITYEDYDIMFIPSNSIFQQEKLQVIIPHIDIDKKVDHKWIYWFFVDSSIATLDNYLTEKNNFEDACSIKKIVHQGETNYCLHLENDKTKEITVIENFCDPEGIKILNEIAGVALKVYLEDNKKGA
jgi:hypothetical protein